MKYSDVLKERLADRPEAQCIRKDLYSKCETQ